jgi:hypothetical protein
MACTTSELEALKLEIESINTEIAVLNDEILLLQAAGSNASRPKVFKAQCITKDEIAVGTTIDIVDIYNQPPSSAMQFDGKLRLLPNQGNFVYTTDKIWKTFDDIFINSPNSACWGFFYSSTRNERWQKDCPLYAFGTVSEIVDSTTMKVQTQMPYIKKDEWPEFSCRTDYMTCNTDAFAIGDIAVVKFENGNIERPVVVGFWIDPKDCYWETWSGPNDNNSWRMYSSTNPTGPFFDELPWVTNPLIDGEGNYVRIDDGVMTMLSRGIYGNPALYRASVYGLRLPSYEGNQDIVCPNTTLEIKIESQTEGTLAVSGSGTQMYIEDASGTRGYVVFCNPYGIGGYPGFLDFIFYISGGNNVSYLDGTYTVDLSDYGISSPIIGINLECYAGEEDSWMKIDYIDFR